MNDNKLTTTKNAKLIRKDIWFKFEDKVNSKGDFEVATETGIVLMEDKMANGSGELCRIGTVMAVGPEVNTDITEGTRIIIAPLRWSLQFQTTEGQCWKTDEDQVCAILD